MNLSQLCSSLQRRISENPYLSEITKNPLVVPTRDGGVFSAHAFPVYTNNKYVGYEIRFGFQTAAGQDVGSMHISIKSFSTADVLFTNSSRRNGSPGIALYLKKYFGPHEMSRLAINKISFLSQVPHAFQRDDSIVVMLSPSEQIINAVGEMLQVFATVIHLLEQQKTA